MSLLFSVSGFAADPVKASLDACLATDVGFCKEFGEAVTRIDLATRKITTNKYAITVATISQAAATRTVSVSHKIYNLKINPDSIQFGIAKEF